MYSLFNDFFAVLVDPDLAFPGFHLSVGIPDFPALGGFFLASFHLRGKLAPKGVVVLHAGLAVIGFLTLLSLMI